jgi:hypothetical protein
MEGAKLIETLQLFPPDKIFPVWEETIVGERLIVVGIAQGELLQEIGRLQERFNLLNSLLIEAQGGVDGRRSTLSS